MNGPNIIKDNITKETFKKAVADLSPHEMHQLAQKLAELHTRMKTLAEWAAECESNLARTAGTAEPSGNIKCE